MNTDLDIPLQPSSTLAGIALTTLALAGASVFSAQLATWIQIAVALAVVGYGRYFFRRYVLLRSPASIVHLTFRGGHWHLKTQQGKRFFFVSRPTCWETETCLVLFFVQSHFRALPVILFRNAIPKDPWRRLRVLLHWGKRR